jgi:serine/threonine protein kinase
MAEREFRLEELAEQVADLQKLGPNDIRITDVEPQRESWMTENLRILATIGSLGPGELKLGAGAPAMHWGPLRILSPLRTANEELFLCREEATGSEQWLRLLPPARHRPQRGRRDLEAEAAVLEKITHPGLARVRGAGAHEGRRGLWTDAVDGSWLCDELDVPFAWPRASSIAIALAEVLAVLHAHGLIHRRLTPEYVRLSQAGPVFVDLGGADYVTSSSDLELAPEVRRGGAPTVRSDVYALGQLLRRMLDRELPIGARSLLDEEPERRPATAGDAAQLLQTVDPEKLGGSEGWIQSLRNRFPRRSS